MAWTIPELTFTHDPTDNLSRDGFDRLYPRPATVDDGNGNQIANPDLALNKVQWRRKCLKTIVRDVAVNEKHFQNEQALPTINIPAEA